MTGRSVLARLVAAFLVATLAVPAFSTTAVAAGRDHLATVDPKLLAAARADPRAQFDVIVTSEAAAGDRKKDQHVARSDHAVKKANGHTHGPLGIVGGVAATVSGAALVALWHDPTVASIASNQRFAVTFDPVGTAAAESSAGMIAVGAPTAWTTFGVTGRGVTVAVVDSGVAAHPDLGVRLVAAIDFTSATPTVSSVPLGDAGGHGTHVAGLVAGDGTLSGGAYTGVAPEASIVDVRVIDATGSTNLATVLRGLQWVLQNHRTYGIRVVNMSFGAAEATSYTQDLLATAAEFLTFAGIVTVVAAGNNGPTGSTITTPGVDPWVITVGAVDDAGTPDTSDDTVATFSSRGPTAVDAIAKPDLVAPGRKMVSLRSPGSALDTLFPDRRVSVSPLVDAPYFRLSGTSMAAPVVAGAVALLLQHEPTLTPAQVKHRLLSTALPLAPSDSNVTGAGMLDLVAALSSTDTRAYRTRYRVSDPFARNAYGLLYGSALAWNDPSFNGIDWTRVTWDNIAWDEITWENFSWESVTWETITWEEITWEDITWESLTSLSAGALSGGGGGGWAVVD